MPFPAHASRPMTHVACHLMHNRNQITTDAKSSACAHSAACPTAEPARLLLPRRCHTLLKDHPINTHATCLPNRNHNHESNCNTNRKGPASACSTAFPAVRTAPSLLPRRFHTLLMTHESHCTPIKYTRHIRPHAQPNHNAPERFSACTFDSAPNCGASASAPSSPMPRPAHIAESAHELAFAPSLRPSNAQRNPTKHTSDD